MKTPQTLSLKAGHCPFTGKQIVKQEERGGEMTIVKLPNYKSHWLQFETGEKMEVGIDKSVKMTKPKAEQVIEAHISYWAEGIVVSADNKIEEIKKTRDQNLDYYSKIKLLKHATNEKSL